MSIFTSTNYLFSFVLFRFHSSLLSLCPFLPLSLHIQHQGRSLLFQNHLPDHYQLIPCLVWWVTRLICHGAGQCGALSQTLAQDHGPALWGHRSARVRTGEGCSFEASGDHKTSRVEVWIFIFNYYLDQYLSGDNVSLRTNCHHYLLSSQVINAAVKETPSLFLPCVSSSLYNPHHLTLSTHNAHFLFTPLKGVVLSKLLFVSQFLILVFLICFLNSDPLVNNSYLLFFYITVLTHAQKTSKTLKFQDTLHVWMRTVESFANIPGIRRRDVRTQ